MSETRTIEPVEAGDVHGRDDGSPVGPWTKVGEQHVSSHRWYDRYWLVLHHDEDAPDVFWGLQYDVGKTEEQETEWPWEKKATEPLNLTRLYGHPVTLVEYRTKPAAEPTPPLPADGATTNPTL